MVFEDLTPPFLESSYRIAAGEFTPDSVFQRFKSRFTELVRNEVAVGGQLRVPLATGGSRLAAGAAVFLDDDTYVQLREVPFDAVDEWLVDVALVSGVLSRDRIARANRGGDLNLFVLYFKADDRELCEADRMRVVQEMMLHIFPEFKGYNLRALAARVRHRSQVLSGQQAGLRFLCQAELPFDAVGPEFLSSGPILMYAERQWVEFASWVGGAFVWAPPQLGFTAAEQRTLRLALRGHRDTEIASACGVSTSTVKKRWDSLLYRVLTAAPNLFPSWTADTPLSGRRGPEKRRDLLQYLAVHLEELRPYDTAVAR